MVRRHDGEVVAPVEHQLRYAISQSICRETSFPRELFDGIPDLSCWKTQTEFPRPFFWIGRNNSLRPQAIPWLHGEIHEGWQIAQADSNIFPKTTTTVNLQTYKYIYHTSQINVYLILYIYIYMYKYPKASSIKLNVVFSDH